MDAPAAYNKQILQNPRSGNAPQPNPVEPSKPEKQPVLASQGETPTGEQFLRFAAPWGTPFEAGKDSDGYFLRIGGEANPVRGDQPTLTVAGIPARWVRDCIVPGHTKVELQDGEMTAIFDPSKQTLWFAYSTHGKLNWFGNNIQSGPDGRLVFLSSMEQTGKIAPWYLNISDDTRQMPGLIRFDETGWIEPIPDAGKDPQNLQWRFIFHSDEHSLLLHIYPGAIIPDAWRRPDPIQKQKYRVQGYFGTNFNREDRKNPAIPNPDLIVIAKRIEIL